MGGSAACSMCMLRVACMQAPCAACRETCGLVSPGMRPSARISQSWTGPTLRWLCCSTASRATSQSWAAQPAHGCRCSALDTCAQCLANAGSARHASPCMQVFFGLPFTAGDRILTSVIEYGSNYIAYLQVIYNIIYQSRTATSAHTHPKRCTQISDGFMHCCFP